MVIAVIKVEVSVFLISEFLHVLKNYFLKVFANAWSQISIGGDYFRVRGALIKVRA
jgi:hypothetical protein